ncbi:unnamed protein product [Adineta ricciae]|uniref:Uncharacterized protein n=1 Tax=Adineta ricciae TaxID=249248 RepID=A0A814LPS8_ADIRI|nr:unnamed protein product [Adineta ricciae]CAF1633739.1 unnamed protein product [Adineta ricciae]
MTTCYDADSAKYEYCASHLSTYVAVGIIIPLAVLFIIALVYFYLRCRQKQLRRAQQQTYMATIIPIYNSDQIPPGTYDYSYPPRYTSMISNSSDKPPSYEQTMQETIETNADETNADRSTAVNSSSSSSDETTRNQS